MKPNHMEFFLPLGGMNESSKKISIPLQRKINTFIFYKCFFELRQNIFLVKIIFAVKDKILMIQFTMLRKKSNATNADFMRKTTWSAAIYRPLKPRTLKVMIEFLSEYQISAKRDPYSRFVVEANTKSGWPKSSWSPKVKLMDQGRITRPQSRL